MPHAAAGIWHVACVPRDHMDMHMRHRLAGGRPGVKAYVVAIRFWIEARIEQRLR